MRVRFLEPEAPITADIVADVLSLVVSAGINRDRVKELSAAELLLLYDWAMREHLHANDNFHVKRREKPWLVDEMTWQGERAPRSPLDPVLVGES